MRLYSERVPAPANSNRSQNGPSLDGLAGRRFAGGAYSTDPVWYDANAYPALLVRAHLGQHPEHWGRVLGLKYWQSYSNHSPVLMQLKVPT